MKKSRILSVVLASALLLAGCAESIENKLETADSYMSDKDYENAVEKYEEILEDEPENVDAYIGLAKAYEKMNDIGKSIEVLNEGLEETDDEQIEKKLNKMVEPCDAIAHQIRTFTTTFLTNAEDMKKEGLIGPYDPELVSFKVIDGIWTLINDENSIPKFGDGTKVTWSGNDIENSFCGYMGDSLRDLKNAYVEITIDKCACFGVAVRMGTSTDPTGITAEDMESHTTSLFAKKDGFNPKGEIIGTNPKIMNAN